MIAALAMPALTPTQIAARRAAIAAARTTLAISTNKGLTAPVASRLDTMLGLPASDPTLGTQL
jgi:hypothetical protein